MDIRNIEYLETLNEIGPHIMVYIGRLILWYGMVLFQATGYTVQYINLVTFSREGEYLPPPSSLGFNQLASGTGRCPDKQGR